MAKTRGAKRRIPVRRSRRLSQAVAAENAGPNPTEAEPIQIPSGDEAEVVRQSRSNRKKRKKDDDVDIEEDREAVSGDDCEVVGDEDCDEVCYAGERVENNEEVVEGGQLDMECVPQEKEGGGVEATEKEGGGVEAEVNDGGGVEAEVNDGAGLEEEDNNGGLGVKEEDCEDFEAEFGAEVREEEEANESDGDSGDDIWDDERIPDPLSHSDDEEIIEEESDAPQSDDHEELLRLGKTFNNPDDFKIAVLRYSLETRCYCSYDKKKQKMQVKIYKDKHSCVRSGYSKMLKQGTIAWLYRERLRKNPKITKQEMVDEIKREYKLTVTEDQCSKAKTLVMRERKATHQEHFSRIWDYQAEIFRSNAGTIFEIETIPGPTIGSLQRFSRLFICFKSQKDFWKRTCRPIIGIDGAFLKWHIKGHLLATTGRDKDNRIVPIAWALVEIENDDNWDWFVRLLSRTLELQDGRNVAIISDKQSADSQRERLRKNPKITKQEMVDEIKREYKLTVTEDQCSKAKTLVMRERKATHQEHFSRIWDYQAEIFRSNAGIIFEIEIIPGPTIGSLQRFSRLFICFKSQKDSWKRTCRPIIGIDGAFLKWHIKGHLLATTGRDRDNRIVPIAWAVVEIENDDNWDWFVRLLSRTLELQDGRNVAIISDKQSGLVKAIHSVIPQAEHRQCARHIMENWKRNSHDMELQRLFWKIARSYTNGEFQAHMLGLQSYNPSAYEYLLKTNPLTWSRAFFRIGSCCNDNLNNLSESFNKTIRQARRKPLLDMLEDIRRQCMVRNAKRYVIADRLKSRFTKRAHMEIEKMIAGSVVCERWMARHNKHEMTGIPCIHAATVIIGTRQKVEDYVSDWYTAINRLGVLPPPWRRGNPGRPKNHDRRKSLFETATASSSSNTELSRIHRVMKCSNCQEEGHNKQGCKNQTVAPPPRRPRGRPRKDQDWDDYDTLFYNAWLGVVLKPTRVADMDLMRRMGIETTVLGMLEAIGLGTICTKQYDMFPELVRQFIATVRVGYEKENEKNARDGFLSFFIRGVRYSLPLSELAEIYGFDGEVPRVALPDRFDGIKNFWSYIGNGEYDSKKSAQTDIRHPALRYVVRLLGHTLLCKMEPGKMRRTEVIFLNYVVGDSCISGRLLTGDPIQLAFLPDASLLHVPPPTRRRRAATRAVSTPVEDAPIYGPAGGLHHSSSSSTSQCELPDTPPIPMETGVFQQYMVDSLKSVWNPIATLSRCRCVRPDRRRQRSPTPPQGADTEHED
ncbi:unnamed protein product [Arabidopsis arenosa]|uniref:Mutator-like transposase n=1 Tax=Arabidopsis arenosa TaxID=38785 RepID=A0A8S1ZP04_ARAAE|nr:unnamed protein product [Arabidopsis arenosa]